MRSGVGSVASRPRFAQEWIQYASKADLFGVNFPSEPKVQDIAYTTEFGITLPATSIAPTAGRAATRSPWSTTRTPRRSTPREPSSARRTAERATRARTTGEATCRARSSSRRGSSSSGTPRSPTSHGPSTDRSKGQRAAAHQPRRLADLRRDLPARHASLYPRGHRAAGAPAPGLFQQSMMFLDEEGKPIRYRSIYTTGYSEALEIPGAAAAARGRHRRRREPMMRPDADRKERTMLVRSVTLAARLRAVRRRAGSRASLPRQLRPHEMDDDGGTVKELHLLVPHSWIYLDVKDERATRPPGRSKPPGPSGLTQGGRQARRRETGRRDQGPVSSAQGRIERLSARIRHADARRHGARARGREGLGWRRRRRIFHGAGGDAALISLARAITFSTLCDRTKHLGNRGLQAPYLIPSSTLFTSRYPVLPTRVCAPVERSAGCTTGRTASSARRRLSACGTAP